MMDEEKFITLVYDALKEEKPDLVVCDFFCAYGLDAADRLNLPVVINAPMPLDLAIFHSRGSAVPGKKCTCACLGCLCLFKTPFMGIVHTAMYCHVMKGKPKG